MTRLIFIKISHTAIWIFFNGMIFCLFYAGITTNAIDRWVWVCAGPVITEGVVLVAFSGTCPLTLMVRKYSDAANDKFDIYLPGWLARYTKLIYTTLFGLAIGLLISRLFIVSGCFYGHTCGFSPAASATKFIQKQVTPDDNQGVCYSSS